MGFSIKLDYRVDIFEILRVHSSQNQKKTSNFPVMFRVNQIGMQLSTFSACKTSEIHSMVPRESFLSFESDDLEEIEFGVPFATFFDTIYLIRNSELRLRYENSNPQLLVELCNDGLDVVSTIAFLISAPELDPLCDSKTRIFSLSVMLLKSFMDGSHEEADQVWIVFELYAEGDLPDFEGVIVKLIKPQKSGSGEVLMKLPNISGVFGSFNVEEGGKYKYSFSRVYRVLKTFKTTKEVCLSFTPTAELIVRNPHISGNDTHGFTDVIIKNVSL